MARHLALPTTRTAAKPSELQSGLIEYRKSRRSFWSAAAVRQVVTDTVPWGRLGMAMDIAKGIVFLASDESYWITGQLIQAAGGVTL